MDRAELEVVKQRFDEEVRRRFPGEAIQRVEVLQYGDAPEIEPGQLLARVVINVPEAEEERNRSFEEFHDARREAFRELRRGLDKLPVPVVLQFVAGGEPAEGEPRGPMIKLAARGIGGEAAGFTPVMARLGAEDLETLDTLITAGIASSRAEAVRWALARIRERPAYEQLRAHTREIAELKAQF
jgi:hypothetical protein